MFEWILKKIIGTKNQRAVKRLWPVVHEINKHEEALKGRPEEYLRERTAQFQERFRAFHEPHFLAGVWLRIADEEQVDACLREVGEKFVRLKDHFPSLDQSLVEERSWSGESLDKKKARIEKAREAYVEIAPRFAEVEKTILDEILPEAYAVVKNAARRLCGQEILVSDQPLTWQMVHFDVQLIGGTALHRGMIAEMATGEGKTLVGTLPVYLNALTGRGVHVITVNDYLARRDSEWMGTLYKFLGLTVGCIQNDQAPDVRRQQYQADITYGTNSEFGFDYLRDNGMARSKDHQVQRGHYFAIIDEVDSVLIDEARTPLIISGPVATASSHQYDRFKPLVEQLVRRQNALCTRLATEANEHFEKGETDLGGRKLFQVRLGQPKNRALLRAMEDPDKRRAMQKSELSFYQDTQKTELFALKEELYYTIEEKTHDADLSEMGRSFLNPDDPDAFVLPDLASAYVDIDNDTSLSDSQKQQKRQDTQARLDVAGQRIHNISQLLRAYCLYEKDKEYVVHDNKVIIVDENTGREMPGRRWSDGLHQAVEAKEGVHIDQETQTLATITIQNYFRLYQKLGGMTGTAETDAAEFHDIYGLDVLSIPTNRIVQRKDSNDAIFKTRREKFNSVLKLIQERHAAGQPLLIGTASVETSETVSRLLKLQKIPHSVLNAKYHRQEAEIVARAGQRGAVTVSTNMAGRGTDIKLGEGVAELGGLFVVGTERHESRRVDRQLRGRCARQGDPGQSKFFISFEDDLMRNFGAAERMTKIMERFGMEEGQELEHPWLNKSVETAQKRVEQRNYLSRKRVLEYDDVMNNQRDVVYTYRNEVLTSPDPRLLLDEVVEKAIPAKVEEFVPKEKSGDEPPAYEALLNWANNTFPLGITEKEAALETKDFDGICQFLIERIKRAYDLKTTGVLPQLLQESERIILLEAIDELWQEHLYAMDGLREGVHLRSYGQKDPLVEFKQEAYVMFEELMGNIQNRALGNLFRSHERLQMFMEHLRQSMMRARQEGPDTQSVQSPRPQAAAASEGEEGGEPVEQGPRITIPLKREVPKVGRNDPCPCGSGKKYKSCCGRAA
ncbi:preprotein translocase subunit SecA [Roseimicrobium gellanilyticum]|uniref:Protein translocase subunit SecA n=1 Tax=Roseimicrobium gellanilyticum TaxID=748857 RepID=A0A366HRY1_9BACT|nr:preprotein translocase subunit SecA [Roseimicrobium gellanilyticum]RBP46440.1 preprotein translocase subunit SecA [Roseimicrobium gellanilyticum]